MQSTWNNKNRIDAITVLFTFSKIFSGDTWRAESLINYNNMIVIDILMLAIIIWKKKKKKKKILITILMVIEST